MHAIDCFRALFGYNSVLLQVQVALVEGLRKTRLELLEYELLVDPGRRHVVRESGVSER